MANENERLVVGIACTPDGKEVSTKSEFIAFCETCWDKTQEHGGATERIWVLHTAGNNPAIVALIGNGPNAKDNTYTLLHRWNSFIRVGE